MTLDNSKLKPCTVDGCTRPDVHHHGVLGGVTQAGHVLSPCVFDTDDPPTDEPPAPVPLDDSCLEQCTVDGCTSPDVHYHEVHHHGGVEVRACDCVDQRDHEFGCRTPRPQPVLTVPIEDVRVGDTLIVAPDTSFEVAAVGALGDVYATGRAGDRGVDGALLRLAYGSLVLVRRSPDAPILDRLAQAADDPRTLLAAMRAAGLTVEVAQ